MRKYFRTLRRHEEIIQILGSQIDRLTKRVDDLKLQKYRNNTNFLLMLPKHLQETMSVLMNPLFSGRATARQIAKKTKKARSVESQYLNTLVTAGYLEKEREGRVVYFSLV